MRARISEKKLLACILLLAVAVLLLFNTRLFDAPVRISEKGLALTALSIALIVTATRLLKKAIVKI